jgi:hypothetical protein
LDLSANTTLSKVTCGNNQIATLDIRSSPEIYRLDVRNMPSLYRVCKGTVHEYFEFISEGSPNAYLSTDCGN